MLRQGAVHRENCFSSWRNETGLLRFFSNKTTQFFQASRIGRQTILGKFVWPACRLQPAVSHPCRCSISIARLIDPCQWLDNRVVRTSVLLMSSIPDFIKLSIHPKNLTLRAKTIKLMMQNEGKTEIGE